MVRFGLALAALAICSTVVGTMWAQPPHDGWPDKDASGREAPMTFNEFHGGQLNYDRIVEALTGAGCTREETTIFVRFDCAVAPSHWYLTRPDKVEHPGVAVAASDEKGGVPAVSHLRMLMPFSLHPERPSAERQEAFAVWAEGLPLHPKNPAASDAGRIDWDAVLKDAPLTNSQMREMTLTFEEVTAKLENASDCKRDLADTYVRFECARSKTRWYLTREGQPAHRALALMFSTPHRGGVENSYILGMPRSFPENPKTGRAMGGGTPAVMAWIATLPDGNNISFGNQLPQLGFSLEDAPLSEVDLYSLGRDAMIQKLTAPECRQRETGEYVLFSCRDSKLLFVLSSPAASVSGMQIAMPDASGQNVHMLWTRQFFGPEQFNDPGGAAFRSWTRGLTYLSWPKLRSLF
ncbi:MAG TPA: hypothetical protein VG942_16025 [Hyphomonadaceae bacterium]|nr:hypothetical protein [Hyphomonadaceae bacterium]